MVDNETVHHLNVRPFGCHKRREEIGVWQCSAAISVDHALSYTLARSHWEIEFPPLFIGSGCITTEIKNG